MELINRYKKIITTGIFKNYNHNFEEEYYKINKFINFYAEGKDTCFDRNNNYGHFTASALLLNKDFSHILFTHHKKLNKWLQLGGHADGDQNLEYVAKKEAIEESGIEKLNIINLNTEITPIDIDIHLIPENNKQKEHYHFDVRFLFTTNEDEYFISEESLDLKWIKLSEVENYTKEKSTLRQIDKINFLVKNSSDLLSKK